MHPQHSCLSACMAKAVGAIRTDETRSLGLVMLMPEFMRSNLICAFSLSDASLLLVAAVFPLISKFLTYLHHVSIKGRPYSRITLQPQCAGAEASTQEEQVQVVQNWTFFPWIVEQEA